MTIQNKILSDIKVPYLLFPQHPDKLTVHSGTFVFAAGPLRFELEVIDLANPFTMPKT